MSDPKRPDLNDMVVDATDLDFLEDLPEKATQGMQGEGDPKQRQDSLQEIYANQPTIGARAGISDEEVKELMGLWDKIERIDVYYPTVKKLEEKMRETRAKLVDQHRKLVSSITTTVKGRAKQAKNSDLTDKYGNTLTYNAAAAKKGADTKRKNASK
jgi:hypothetical protein